MLFGTSSALDRACSRTHIPTYYLYYTYYLILTHTQVYTLYTHITIWKIQDIPENSRIRQRKHLHHICNDSDVGTMTRRRCFATPINRLRLASEVSIVCAYSYAAQILACVRSVFDISGERESVSVSECTSRSDCRSRSPHTCTTFIRF